MKTLSSVAWRENLPALCARLARQWKFRESGSPPAANGGNFLAYVEQEGGGEAVLKLFPDPALALREFHWLELQSGGAVEPLRVDEEEGALLLPRLKPGSSAKDLVLEGRDEEATRLLARAMLRLRPGLPAPGKFPTIFSLAKSLRAIEGKVNGAWLDRAVQVFLTRGRPSAADILLHGDLHHENLLSHGNDWLVIDPHGYVGPKAFEVAALFRNPHDVFPTGDLGEVLRRRAEVLQQELPVFSRQEILDWAFAGTLLSVAWSAEDEGLLPPSAMAVASALFGLT